MPLVARYNDWATDDQSYTNPRSLAFDHRLNAGGETLDSSIGEDGLAGVKSNVQAACLIATLDASYGWTEAGEGDWIYDPTASTVQSLPTLGAHFGRNLRSCIHEDRRNVLDTLLSNSDPSKNITDENVKGALEEMTWPADGSDPRSATTLISRFAPESEYVAGTEWASGYHLGDGIVGTAGHCLLKWLLKNELHTLNVIFGWSGDVRRKRFAANQVFDIERALLYDAPVEYQDVTDSESVASWARKWDNAVLKLRGTSEQFQGLKKVKLASQPPRFGSPVYNAGHPLGTPMKISCRSHVLRHALFNGNYSPFAHDIDPCGTYSTDLDQFPGNSGGPVFDGLTGKVVGHTVSTQSAVSESSITDIETWEKEFLINSDNYKNATEIINPHLARQHPQDPAYRVHPKFYRTLSGKPAGGALFLNTTFICPGDSGLNGVPQAPDTYQAVFNRHRWDSLDVVFRNLTGRIDRVYIFTRPLSLIVAEYPGSTLTITLIGPSTFRKPSSASTVSITMGVADWNFCLENLTESTNKLTSGISYSYTLDLSTKATTRHIPPGCLSAPLGLASWSKLRLEQPCNNPPVSISLELVVRRAPFPFPVDKSWPPNRPDVTEDPKDEGLVWPAEEFRFATTVGGCGGVTQMDEEHPAKPVVTRHGELFQWVADIDRVWSDPGQVGVRGKDC